VFLRCPARSGRKGQAGVCLLIHATKGGRRCCSIHILFPGGQEIGKKGGSGLSARSKRRAVRKEDAASPYGKRSRPWAAKSPSGKEGFSLI